MNSFLELRAMILGRTSSRGVVTAKSATRYSVATGDGVKNFTSPLEFKVGDEVSILENGSLQPADNGQVFYV